MLNVQSKSQEPLPQVVTQLPGFMHSVSKLSPLDAALFRSAFQQEATCYANSWLYLLRSTRDDQGEFGYKFVAEGMLAGIGYRDHAFHIVHPIGAERFPILMDLCVQIYELLHCSIILKKVDQILYEQLAATQLFQTQADGLVLFEEEAYPEHILELERLFGPALELEKQALPFMKKVKRFERSMKLWPAHNVSWKELESNPGFQGLFGHNPDKYNSYKQIIKEASSSNIDDCKYKVCTYYDERGSIHGLYVSEMFDEGIMGLYCAVSSKSSPGITEWMDYDFFQQLFHQGIHTLYLGGSETEGVHAYVQKLLPIVPPYCMRPLQMYLSDVLSA